MLKRIKKIIVKNIEKQASCDCNEKAASPKEKCCKTEKCC